MTQRLAVALCSAFVLALSTLAAPSAALADTCFICTSGSSGECGDAKYCHGGGKDTSDARRKCRDAGCKIGGTGSCPTAANVKVCKVADGPKLPKTHRFARYTGPGEWEAFAEGP